MARATVWEQDLNAAQRAALRPGVPDGLNRRPDVLIVGGGVIGLATAVACWRAGWRAQPLDLGTPWPAVVARLDQLALGAELAQVRD